MDGIVQVNDQGNIGDEDITFKQVQIPPGCEAYVPFQEEVMTLPKPTPKKEVKTIDLNTPQRNVQKGKPKLFISKK